MILRASFCRSRIERRTFSAKSSLLVTAMRPTIRFQMLPDQLVGVAVWRIRRQKEQAQFRTQRLHESADFLRTMSRATIDDQKDFALGALDQAFQEFDEDIGVDAALVAAGMM